MKFVENHASDTSEFRVGLDHARQHAFRDDLHPATTHAFTLDAIADPAPDLFTKHFGQAFRRRTGSDPARFEHKDAAFNHTGFKEIERHAGRLSGAWRRLQDGMS